MRQTKELEDFYFLALPNRAGFHGSATWNRTIGQPNSLSTTNHKENWLRAVFCNVLISHKNAFLSQFKVQI